MSFKKAATFSFLIWFICVVIVVINYYLAKSGNPIITNSIYVTIVLVSVILGICTFISGFVCFGLSIGKRNKSHKASVKKNESSPNVMYSNNPKNSYLVLLGIMLLVILAYLAGTKQNLMLGISKNNNFLNTTPMPTQDKVKFLCGPGQHSGQSIYLENASDCQFYMDCMFNDNSWQFMTIKDCYTAQIKENAITDNKLPASGQVTQNVSKVNSNEPWGVAKQVSEHTWTMKVGQDATMATPNEIYEALNTFRQRNGSGRLDWDDRLARYAQERAIVFTNLGKLDEHAGFNDYVKSIDNIRNLGFWSVGENSSYGYRVMGVHLIEWVYAGDKPHNDNQLNPKWTNVGVGVNNTETDIIFGANRI